MGSADALDLVYRCAVAEGQHAPEPLDELLAEDSMLVDRGRVVPL
jgi:hypothetical protein